MTITKFTTERSELISKLRKTIKGSQAFELHLNNLRVLHVNAGVEVLKAAPAM